MPKKGRMVESLRTSAGRSSAPITSLGQQHWQPKPWPSFPPNVTDASFDRRTEEGLEAWVQWSYCKQAFDLNGNFIGFTRLKEYLTSRPCPNAKPEKIWNTVDKLRKKPELKYAFPLMEHDCNQPMTREIRAIKRSEAVQKVPTQFTVPAFTGVPPVLSQGGSKMQDLGTETYDRIPDEEEDPGENLLGRLLSQMHHVGQEGVDEDVKNPENDSRHSLSGNRGHLSSDSTGGYLDPNDLKPDFDAMEVLLTSANSSHESGDCYRTAARYAPLLDESLVRDGDIQNDLPQYGLMGTHDQNTEDPRSKLFLNTNIPFSAFVCGVQGSGKSHTTSCILENCLIPSKILGVLKEPLSALVFSYGLFTGNGAGFSISEAAFLGMPNPNINNAHAKKIKVLVCETNFKKISKLYERLPNVTVSCFKLNPRNLDIDLILTLMNVDETGRVPLYMAQILRILRDMATTSTRFDYNEFKQRIAMARFEPMQQNHLDIRLGVLESFLDLTGTFRNEMVFKPGEITIMDMSCPFVDVNTACIMVRCSLQHYLQSQASGKLVVLDEAHKYMLDVPAAKDLNAVLLDTIRMQRHSGTRVLISTQEPTLLTDLIALCSIAVIHRFSSPEWFTAIRRHIRIPETEREELMERIEALPTGTAIVYSPKSVLERRDDGTIKQGTGIMLEVKMRQRITADGGKDVFAV